MTALVSFLKSGELWSKTANSFNLFHIDIFSSRTQCFLACFLYPILVSPRQDWFGLQKSLLFGEFVLIGEMSLGQWSNTAYVFLSSIYYFPFLWPKERVGSRYRKVCTVKGNRDWAHLLSATSSSPVQILWAWLSQGPLAIASFQPILSMGSDTLTRCNPAAS